MTSENQTQRAFAAVLAVDWADASHDYALLPEGCGKAEAGKLRQDPGELAVFVAGLRQRFGGRPVAVVVEQSRGALVHALLGHDHLVVHPVRPAALASFRKALCACGAKDDPTDAALLLEFFLKHPGHVRAWKGDDEATRTLALLVEERRRAVAERTRLVEQMLAALKQFHPQAIELLGGNVGSALAVRLLARWPDFQSLRRAGTGRLRRLLHACRHPRAEDLLRRFGRLCATPPLTCDAAVCEAGAARVARLAAQISVLAPRIAGLDRRIAELFARHPDAPLFAALPGAGKALAPRLLALFGSERGRWERAGDVASFTGIAPVTRRSGNSWSVGFRRACPKFPRQSLHEFAAASTRYCPWAGGFYQACRQRGMRHHQAVRALAFKWVRIIFHCWKTRTPYEESKCRQAARWAPAPTV